MGTKYTTSELIAFSREWTLMRERANEICSLCHDESAIQTRLNDDYYTIEPQEWLKRYDGLKSLQKRIKLKIHAFVRRHYGVDSICVKEYIGLDYVDMMFKFFEVVRTCYNANTSLN